MENNELMLLSQLMNSMNEYIGIFETSYNEKNKERFDKSKAGLLELQRKINFLVKNS